MVERGTAASHVRVMFPVGEALFALDALSVRAAEAWEKVRHMTVTSAPVDERDIAEMAAVQLDRAHRRLDGAIYQNCRWLPDDGCRAEVKGYDERGLPFCGQHLEQIRRIHEFVTPR